MVHVMTTRGMIFDPRSLSDGCCSMKRRKSGAGVSAFKRTSSLVDGIIASIVCVLWLLDDAGPSSK